MIITPLQPGSAIVDDKGVMLSRFTTFCLLVSKLGVLLGPGSPEGVVEATQTQLYMDTLGVASSILYIKRDSAIGGDRTLGWILV